MKKIIITLGIATLYGLVFWGATSCNSPAAKEIKKLEDSGLPASVIQSITAQAASAKGEPGAITILVDGTEYPVEVQEVPEGSAQATFPDCFDQVCEGVQHLISQICKREGWPPRTPILICNAKGSCCYCHCK